MIVALWHMLALLGGVTFAFASRELVSRLAKPYLSGIWALIAAYAAWPVLFVVGLAVAPWLNGLIFPNPTDTLESNGVYLLTRMPWAFPLLIGAPVVMLCDLGIGLARRVGVLGKTSLSLARSGSAIHH